MTTFLGNPVTFTGPQVRDTAQVTNISAHLPASISIQHFKKALLYYFTINNPGIQDYYFTQADLEAIYRLKEQKYATASWNFNTYTL